MHLPDKVIISIANYTGTDVHLSDLVIKVGNLDVPMPMTIKRRHSDLFAICRSQGGDLNFRFLLHVGEIRYGIVRSYQHADFRISLTKNDNNIQAVKLDKKSWGFDSLFDAEIDSLPHAGALNYRITLHNKKT